MLNLAKEAARNRIAARVAKECSQNKDQYLFVNLGVGLPSHVADYLENGRVFIQVENGMLGAGPAAKEAETDPHLINASREKITQTPGCSFFDSAMSFAMINGKHIDITVLGAFEVDEQGSVANWIIPDGKRLGVGGAMDLVNGCAMLVIAMQHLDSSGQPRIKKRCTLPLTAVSEVDLLVTEYAVFRFQEGEMLLMEIAPEISLEELRVITEANFQVSPELATYNPL